MDDCLLCRPGLAGWVPRSGSGWFFWLHWQRASFPGGLGGKA